MDNSRYQEMVKLLLDRSKHGRLAWERTVEDGVYQTTLGVFTVKVQLRKRIIPQNMISFGDPKNAVVQIYNPDAELLEEITGDYIADSPETHFNDELMEIFKLAKRHALNVDNAIDSIINSLETK